MSAKTKNLYTSLNRQIQIKIKYKEDDDGTLEKGVIFSSLISKKITAPLFDQWNCGQNHEDERCSKVIQNHQGDGSRPFGFDLIKAPLRESRFLRMY